MRKILGRDPGRQLRPGVGGRGRGRPTQLHPAAEGGRRAPHRAGRGEAARPDELGGHQGHLTRPRPRGCWRVGPRGQVGTPQGPAPGTELRSVGPPSPIREHVTVSTAATRPVVLLAEKLAPSAVALLGDDVDIRHVDGTDRPALLAALADADALLVRSATMVDAEALGASSRLKVVARAGVGLDNVDVPAATARGVMVVNAPTSNIVSAAEHAVALLLAAARNIPAADASLRAGQWKRSSFTGVELDGKTVGIVGLGKIGQLVAQRLAAFGVAADRLRPLRGAGPGRAAGHRAAGAGRAAAARRRDLHPPAQDPGDAGPDRQGPARADQARRDHRQRRPRRPGRRGRAGRGGAQRPRRRAPASTSTSRSRPPPARCSSCRRSCVTPHLGASTDEAQDRAGTDVARSVQLALAGEFVPDAVNVQVGGAVGEEVRPWLPLVQKLGTMLYAVAGAVPSSVTVDVAGELAAEDVSVLQLAALRGLFTHVVEDQVTFVNAPALAAERGVDVELHHRSGEREPPQRGAAAGGHARRRVDHRVRHPDRPRPGAEAGRGQRPALRPAGRGRLRAAASTPTGPA